MWRLLCVGLVTMMIGVNLLPALAQSDRVELTGDYSVVAPEDWTQRRVSAGRGTRFINDDSTLSIFDPEQLGLIMRPNMKSDLKTALIALYNIFNGFRVEEREIVIEQFNGRDAAMWYYTFTNQPGTQGVFVVLKLDDERFLALDVYGPDELLDENMRAARALARSLRTAEELAQASGEPCTVSTDVERSASLRVGPGENRTSVAFLPAGADFAVLGQSSDDDGNIWFKLDKADAAPKSSANEIWVSSDNVTTSGDCEAVVDADAPPVVPIVAAPPQAGGSGGGNTNPPVAGNITPLGGIWTFSFSRQTNASCEGTGNFVINTAEAWEDWTEADYVIQRSLFASGGGTFTFDRDVYRGTGNNRYFGTWSWEDGRNTQIYVTVTSPSSMVGQMTGNFTYQGTPCSVTTDLSVTRG